jgi:hypothetical protein
MAKKLKVTAIHPLDFAVILESDDGPLDLLRYRLDRGAGIQVTEIPEGRYKGVYRLTSEARRIYGKA